MTQHRAQVYFFLGIFALALGLTYLILRPFLLLILSAGVLAILMRPIFRWFVKYYRGQRGLAAFSTVFLALLILLIPLVFIVISLSIEALQFFSYLRTGVDFSQIQQALTFFVGDRQAADITARLSAAVNDVASFIQPAISNLSSSIFSIFSNTVNVVFSLIMVLFVMYYILKDGHLLKKQMLDLSPLDDEVDESLFKRVHDAVTAVAYGQFVVAISKGIVGGILFLVLGLPSPVFWGTIIAFSHLVPGIGTAIVTAPFAVWLFMTGQYATGIIFTIAAIAVLGLADNFITPQLISSRTQLHPLLILLALLGGLIAFGPIGLFFGPIILAVMTALIGIYRKDFRTEVKKL